MRTGFIEEIPRIPIQTATLNDVDPPAWLAKVLDCFTDHLPARAGRVPASGLARERKSAAAERISSRSAIDSFSEIATLRIELKDSDPLTWRELEVPTSITLKVLQDIILTAMGWLDYHLWEMVIARETYGLPIDEDCGSLPYPSVRCARSRHNPDPLRLRLRRLLEAELDH